MKMLAYSLFISFLIIHTSCHSKTSVKQLDDPKVSHSVESEQMQSLDGLSKAYFASGCFWCVEAVYESVNGVHESISGYSGGHTKNPTYASSNTGRTGHAEAVEIYYDSTIVDFPTLVDVYFGSQNVAQANGQGPDKGSQYRSIIFFQNSDEEQIILQKNKSYK